MRPVRAMVLAIAAALGIALVATPLDSGVLGSEMTESFAVIEPPPLAPAELSARVDPFVVTISAEWGLVGVEGTGFVVTPDGTVVTNFHVVENAESLTAVRVDGLIYDATVAGYDKTRDLAVLQLAAAQDLPVAELGLEPALEVGDPVTAIGNASGAGVLVPAPGRVVALDRKIVALSSVDGSRNELTGMIEIDADVRPGDSGGPLVDAWGRVVGVDAAGLSDEARGTDTAPAVAPEAYAIPIADAAEVVEQVRTGVSAGTVHVGPTPYLGVSVRDVSPFERGFGASVRRVDYGSPAESVGLAGGDVIVSFDGRSVSKSDDLVAQMVGRRPGDTVELTWTTPDGSTRSGVVTLDIGYPTA